jgi:hypothetical protein
MPSGNLQHIVIPRAPFARGTCSWPRAVALCVALAIICAPSHSQEQTPGDWVAKHFVSALEEFFPIRNAPGDFIAVRTHQSGTNDALEFSFILQNTQDPHAISAVVDEAQGASLYHQIAALHAKDPAESFDAMGPQLKIRTWNLSTAQCPAVLAQFNAFQHIPFVRPRDEDEPAENPVVYEINETVDGGSSQVIEAIPTRAIPRWADETRKALLSCVGAPGSQPGAASQSEQPKSD